MNQQLAGVRPSVGRRIGASRARRPLRWWCLAVLAAAAQACALHLPAASRPFDRSLTLNAHPVTIHFANRYGSYGRPLLLYTTGDGGWARKDLALYKQIVSWGYPTAAFSAPNYLKHLRGEQSTTPERIGRDYAHIIEFAAAHLALDPGTPVVLIGVSRGAGLEVVAAGDSAVRTKLGGVLAIALTREEEYVRWFGLRLPLLRRPAHPVMVQLYEYLPLLGSLPVAVVQSTRDAFLPAAAAAHLFGPNTGTRRFHSIDARNHSFGGAREQMYETVHTSVRWIDSLVVREDTR
jgi:hypothetical protein